MAFIKNGPSVGDRVVLNRNVEVLAGIFEKGTVMTLLSHGERGWDMEDDEGNKLLETGLSNLFEKE